MSPARSRSATTCGTASTSSSCRNRPSAACAVRSRARVYSRWAWAAGIATPVRRTSGASVKPCTIKEITMTAVASTTTRSRCRSGAPPSIVNGIDNVAASGTTPRAPAQEMTAGICHDVRCVPRRNWAKKDSGNTQATRTTMSVAAIKMAGGSHDSPDSASARISVGSCSPIRLNTTLSSRNTTVPYTAVSCRRMLAVVSVDAW
jgi:hypothetical protein